MVDETPLQHAQEATRPSAGGDIKFLYVDNAKILAFTRTYEDETLLIISNLSRFSQSAEIELSDYHDAVPVELFSKNHFPAVGELPYHFTLAPYAYQWFLLEKSREYGDDFLADKKPIFALDDWKQITSRRAHTPLEKKLPQYLKTCRWFGGKSRTIRSIHVSEAMELPLAEGVGALLVLEISYNEGLDEYYQLPISFIPGRT